tara:strand:- start:2598 stop:2933 length:336 start_codon:yes stop_codon:yes gene_type:complete
MANHHLPYCLFRSFRCEEKYDNLGDDTILDRRPNGPTKNGSASVSWMNRDQPPTPSIQVVNRLMSWLLWFEAGTKNVDACRFADHALNGWMGIPKHGYFSERSLFKRCSTP